MGSDEEWHHRVLTLLSDNEVLHGKLREFRAEIKEFDEVIRGNPREHEDGIETRLHQVERAVTEIKMAALGDSSRSIKSQLEQISRDLRELRSDLAEIKRSKELKVQVRRDWLTFWAPVIGGWLALCGLVLTNLDKIAKGAVTVAQMTAKHESPVQELGRLEQEIGELKKKRGPLVKKRLAELEKQAQEMQSVPEVWK